MRPPGWDASPSQGYPPAVYSPVPIYTPGSRVEHTNHEDTAPATKVLTKLDQKTNVYVTNIKTHYNTTSGPKSNPGHIGERPALSPKSVASGD